MKQNFWRRSLQFPPVLVRLLARRPHGPPLSTMDILEGTVGLSVHKVETISQATDWSCCTVVEMRQFLIGCHCDWENPKHLDRMMDYIRKKPTWQFLRKSPHWHSYYEPLLERYRQSVTRRN